MSKELTPREGLQSLSSWVRHRSIAYLTGRGIIFGADAEIFPRQAIDRGKFPIYMDVVKTPVVSVCDSEFTVCANNVWDYVFIGKRLEDLQTSPKAFFKEASKKLKAEGHLVVFLSINNGKVNSFTPDSVKSILHEIGSWKLKDSYERDGCFLQIYKKLPTGNGVIERVKSTKPRACIVRYGAMGDMIMLTPLIRQLAEDGYEVTLNISPYAEPIIKHNPYVHNLVIQERDAIPNSTLGPYWNEWKNEYEKYINLSESIEGTLLKVEGRRDYFTHQSWRHERCDRNYYDFTMERGGYPEAKGTRGELYFSRPEQREAQWFRNKLKDRKLFLWALNGSSHHKRYGLFKPVLDAWLSLHPDVTVVTVGDARAKELEFEHPQIIRGSGEWPIRQSLALVQVADAVIGPESVMTNAAGCYDVPKITFLSHSSHENLCKYWINDYCLAPDPVLAPCYPCHQLHYSLKSCPQTTIYKTEDNTPIAEGPVCAMGAIRGEVLIDRLNEVYALGSQRQMEQIDN